MMRYHIQLEGCFKPHVRMTQRGKYVRPEAQAYLTSKDELQRQLNAEMVDRVMFPPQQPLEVSILIGHKHGFHNRDLDNEVTAILAAMQGIVFENDCWVDDLYTRRQLEDKCGIFIEVKD